MPRVEQSEYDDGEEDESLEELKDRWRERSGKNEDGQAMSIPMFCLGMDNCKELEEALLRKAPVYNAVEINFFKRDHGAFPKATCGQE